MPIATLRIISFWLFNDFGQEEMVPMPNSGGIHEFAGTPIGSYIDRFVSPWFKPSQVAGFACNLEPVALRC